MISPNYLVQSYLVILLIFLSTNIAFSQSPKFWAITDEDGLPSMTVYDILQDQKGFIWLGTEAGICKYDGYKFQTFEIPNSKGKSFTHLMEDKEGRIYFSNFANQLFYFYQEKIHQLELPNTVQKYKLQDYLIDENDQVWIISDKIYRYHPKNNEWNIFNLEVVTNDNTIRNIELDAENQIWVHLYDEIKLINSAYQIKDEKIQYEVAFHSFPTFGSFTIQNQKLLLFHSSYGDICTYTLQNNSYKQEDCKKIPLPNSYINDIWTDKQKNTWFLTTSGILLSDEKDKYFPNKAVYLKDKIISGMIQDNEGNYWVTTIGDGVYMSPNNEILTYNSNTSNFAFDKVNCIIEDGEHNLIIGTNGNKVFRFNTKDKVISTYQLNNGDIECLFLDKHEKQLYIENGSLVVFDLENSSKLRYLGAGSTPKDIESYQKKYLVIANGNGAMLVSKDGESSILPQSKYRKNFTLESDYRIWLRKVRSHSVSVDEKQDRIWVGYADALYYYQNARQQELTTPKGEAIIALDLVFAQDGTLWIGTAQQGIFALDRNLNIKLHLTIQEGLISNLCRVVEPYGENFG